MWGALNKARRRAWALAPDGVPASRYATQNQRSTIVIDIDASVVPVHSDKEEATPTLKKTFGYHPPLALCDNTGELLASLMLPGRAGSNTATDHIQVLTHATVAVPGTHRKDLLIRCDGAGASHALLDWLTEQASAVRGRRLEYSVGFALTGQVNTAISALPASAWTPAINQDGHARTSADVAELTGVMDLGR